MKKIIRKIFSEFFLFLEKQNNQDIFDSLIEQGWLSMGRHTYGLPKIFVYQGSEAKVTIGNFCSIAPGVTFITGGIHPENWVSTYPFRINWNLDKAFKDGMPATKGDINIGSDVWIGTNALILSGVQVGDGAIIGANSVVTKNVPPFAIVAGNPAIIIRFRFDQNIIDNLLRIKWWDWNDEIILENVNLISSNDIKEFILIFGNM